MSMAPRRPEDFPPGLAGGMEHDDEDHRVGETGQTGPEAPGDLDRAHPDWHESGTTEGEDRAERNAGG
jgi:hypothetical protein